MDSNIEKDLPLEDEYFDIVKKAFVGNNLSKDEITVIYRIEDSYVKNFLSGNILDSKKRDQSYLKLAEVCGLDFENLLEIKKIFLERKGIIKLPIALDNMQNVFRATTKYNGDWTVNSYLVWDKSRNCVIFDTGMDANLIVDKILENSLIPRSVFITHCHYDHIEDISTLVNFAKNISKNFRVFVHNKELMFSNLENLGALVEKINISEDDKIEYDFGNLKIKAKLTAGHSSGGLSYFISSQDFAEKLVIVGDSIFARSVGKIAHSSYKSGLKMIFENILSERKDSVLLPGHGPPTTIADELKYNPFFSAKFEIVK